MKFSEVWPILFLALFLALAISAWRWAGAYEEIGKAREYWRARVDTYEHREKYWRQNNKPAVYWKGKFFWNSSGAPLDSLVEN